MAWIPSEQNPADDMKKPNCSCALEILTKIDKATIDEEL